MHSYRKNVIFLTLLFIFVAAVFLTPDVFSQNDKLQSMVEAHEKTKEGLTLLQMLKTGGFIMIILGLLSIGAVAIIVYLFMTLKEDILTPQKFSEDVVQALEKGDENKVNDICQNQENIFARMVSAGMRKKNSGAVFVREAIENSAKNEITRLWQHISYLADIAAVAPLIGLLGTVIGMIQAFNVIAFQSAVVKPMLLAGGVSKAMVTTAGGLTVAIPVMIFYAFFRGRVQEIANVVETFSTDLVKIMEKGELTV